MSLFADETPNYSNGAFPELRPFQATSIDRLRDGVRNNHRVQMVCAPTGSGKTVLAMKVIHETLLKGNRCMFVCDRRNLINQTSEVADSLGLSAHGIIQSHHWRTNLRMPFQIASIQTLMRRGIPDDFDVVVVDEAHTQYASMMEHIKTCRAKVIGLSATPFSPGLGQTYSNLINAATMSELTQQGILVPIRPFTCTKIDMRGAETRGGEWTEKAAETRGMEIIGDVVTEWTKFASDKKTIVFGATIAHCEEMARQFNDAGYRAEVFCATTTDEEREVILAEYVKPDSSIRVLVSVEALAKGFDVKDVGCVCDCRPLRKSLSTAIQMWGRGLRSSPGKECCFILDFSGNLIRFADDFSEFFYSGLDALDMGEKLDKTVRKDDEEKEPPKCPSCGFSPCGKICIQCGHERKSQSNVEVVAGSMSEILLNGRKLADDGMHLYQQLCTYHRSHGNPSTSKGRAYNQYKQIMGKFPPNTWRFDEMPNVPITPNVANKIKSLRIAYAKAMESRKAA